MIGLKRLKFLFPNGTTAGEKRSHIILMFKHRVDIENSTSCSIGKLYNGDIVLLLEENPNLLSNMYIFDSYKILSKECIVGYIETADFHNIKFILEDIKNDDQK